MTSATYDKLKSDATLFEISPANGTSTRRKSSIVQGSFQKAVQNYFNTENFDVNWKIDGDDGFSHHHYGLGSFDASILKISNPVLQLEKTAQELHRMENKQAEFLLNHFGDVQQSEKLLDAGCGRGGTSLMAALKFGCFIDAVNISEKQIAHATAQAKQLQVDSRVHFHFLNMLKNGLEDESVQVVWNNESTMYVDLFDLFKEHSRVLKVGGRYLTMTGAYTKMEKPEAVKGIDEFYGCNCHQIATYSKALLDHGLVPIQVMDLTELALPYWELRQQSELANGVEDFFLDAYLSGEFRYMLIVAEKLEYFGLNLNS